MLKPQDIEFLRRLDKRSDIEFGVERTVRNSLLDDSKGLRFPALESEGAVVTAAGQIELPPITKMLEYLRKALLDLGIVATPDEIASYLDVRKNYPPEPIPYRSVEETMVRVQTLFQSIPRYDPSMQGASVPILWLNCEFLDAFKGEKLARIFALILSCSGVMGVAEANADGIKPMANLSGYHFLAATPNDKGQACGLLWHPATWEPVSQLEHSETANIEGMLELRPTLEVVLRHVRSGIQVRFLASHFKSLRGGWDLTTSVRFEQSMKLLAAVENEPLMPTIAQGDYNCFLNFLRPQGTKDVDPFFTNGWSLLGGTEDVTSTHAKHGRIDGLFYKWLPDGMRVDDYKVIPIYAEVPEVSDHAAVMGTLHLPTSC
jgi:hypothetical protein